MQTEDRPSWPIHETYTASSSHHSRRPLILGTYRGTPGTALADRRMYAASQIDLGTEYEFCLPGEVPPRMVELLKNTHALLG